MKLKLFIIIVFCFFEFTLSQKKDSTKDETPFNYVEIKEEFDLLVYYTMVNPECATKDKNSYSVIIGTTIIDNYIEKISVLVPCLNNEFQHGDLISIKPIKTPKKNIIYAVRTYSKDGQDISEVFGAEFRAVWGEVSQTL